MSGSGNRLEFPSMIHGKWYQFFVMSSFLLKQLDLNKINELILKKNIKQIPILGIFPGLSGGPHTYVFL